MTPSEAANRTAFAMWYMTRALDTRDAWTWTHDRLFGAALYAGASGNYADEEYFNALAETADDLAAERPR